MTDESYDMRTIEGCIGWGLFRNPTERQRLEAELSHLRAVEAAALVLRARVWDWGVVPFLGPGHEEEYDFANNAAEDRILEAADAFDAAASACDKGTLGEGDTMKRGELSGLVVVSARVWLNGETRLWSWEIVTNMTNSQSGGFDTALAAARSLVHELRRHSPEF